MAVRLLGRGSVSRTVVTFGLTGTKTILGPGEQTPFESGDRIKLKGRTDQLAIKVERLRSSIGGKMNDPNKDWRGLDGLSEKVSEADAIISTGGDAAQLETKATDGKANSLTNEGEEFRGLMLVLVGLPGSGKSTFSESLMKCGKWTRINQDSIKNGKPGTRDQCLNAASAALQGGKRVIIDRVNASKEQREYFLKVAAKYNVPSHALVLNLMPKICVERVVNREGHEGGVQGKKGARVVHFHKNSFVDNAPSFAEGFSSVQICNDSESVAESLEFWKKVTTAGTEEKIALLSSINQLAVGEMKDWRVKEKKSPNPNKAKLQDSTRPESRKYPRTSSTVSKRLADPGQESNAFAVLMDSARALREGSAGASGGGEKGSRKGSLCDRSVSRSTSFPHQWQQVLYQVAMHPEDYKQAHPSLKYDEQCVLIKDTYPKGKYHFLVMARNPFLEQPLNLEEQHCKIVECMKSFGEARIKPLRSRGIDFKLGFHSVPSMRQLHLHAISTDLNGTGMKNKKHWNSFNTDFFLNVDEVISTLRDGGKVSIDQRHCKHLLKLPLKCNKCSDEFSTMPSLKSHIAQCAKAAESSGQTQA